jgi:hypothetical protein
MNLPSAAEIRRREAENPTRCACGQPKETFRAKCATCWRLASEAQDAAPSTDPNASIRIVQRGQHPNSLANLVPRGKGDGRTARRSKPISDRLAEQVEKMMPDELCAKMGLPNGATFADGIAKRLIVRALTGDGAAAREITDRIEGRTRERLDLEATASDVRIVVVESGGIDAARLQQIRDERADLGPAGERKAIDVTPRGEDQ